MVHWSSVLFVEKREEKRNLVTTFGNLFLSKQMNDNEM
jgi:hypothetical protein